MGARRHRIMIPMTAKFPKGHKFIVKEVLVASISIKVLSYDDSANKTATKTFNKVPSSALEDTAAQASFVTKYAALTNASTTAGKLVVETDIDLD